MADEPETPGAEEELLLTDEVEDDEQEIPTFGDDADEQDSDTGLVKHLRSQIRERDKRLADVERRLPPEQPIEVGPKPTQADFDYDEDKYDEAMEAWRERKAAAERQTSTQTQTREQQQQQLNERLTKFSHQSASLTQKDAADHLETAKTALGDGKFVGVLGLLDDATDGAKFMAALGSNPKYLDAIASETDGIRLVKQIAKLEGQLKMVKRRKPPEPEKIERGSAPVSHVPADKVRAKLEKEADESGDYTKLAKYDYAQKQKAR